MSARMESGLDRAKIEDANFLQFLVEDKELPGIDCSFSLDPADLENPPESE